MSARINKRGRGCITAIALLVILAVAAIVFIYDQNNRMVVDELSVHLENLPKGFEGFRIAHVSDLHGKEYGKNNKNLIEKIKESKPDMIAITGDIIEDEEQLPKVEEFLKGIADIAPVYYVTGNHEWSSGTVQDVKRILAETGGKIFQNTYETLKSGGSEIILAGVDDPNGPADQKTLRELTREIRSKKPNAFILLLAHRNENIGEYARNGINLALAGHAHGGVIRLPYTDGLIDTQRNLFPSYTSGAYQLDDTWMVVSRGLGNGKSVPTRLFNHPQLLIISLERELADES